MNIWDCIKVTDELGELTDQCFVFTKTYPEDVAGSHGKYVLAFGPLKLGDCLDVVIETDTKKEYISIVSAACELVKSQVFVVNPVLTHSRNTL
tara:strand:+ start:363 stop:641 length:279 start_codon:yes stop_codon:yes gene_type:complete